MSERIFQTAVERYGVAAQTVLLAEECGELVAAASRVLRGRIEASAFAEEIADVRIMLDQMEHAYGLAAEVSDWRAKKLARLAERLDLVPEANAEPAPRRTLADVVANPPEGWAVTELPTGDPAEPLYRFECCREVIVLFEPEDRDDPVEVLVSECTTLAKAASHVRAVADLLDLLAEVSS